MELQGENDHRNNFMIYLHKICGRARIQTCQPWICNQKHYLFRFVCTFHLFVSILRFTAQSTQWGRYVKHGQLTKPHFLLGRLSPLKRLTLNVPRKPASENVVCLCHLLNILANFSNLFLHRGKQCGPWFRGAVWSGSTLFAKTDLKWQADDKADNNCCDWWLKG